MKIVFGLTEKLAKSLILEAQKYYLSNQQNTKRLV